MSDEKLKILFNIAKDMAEAIRNNDQEDIIALALKERKLVGDLTDRERFIFSGTILAEKLGFTFDHLDKKITELCGSNSYDAKLKRLEKLMSEARAYSKEQAQKQQEYVQENLEGRIIISNPLKIQ